MGLRHRGTAAQMHEGGGNSNLDMFARTTVALPTLTMGACLPTRHFHHHRLDQVLPVSSSHCDCQAGRSLNFQDRTPVVR
jgi:hypothetical protein